MSSVQAYINFLIQLISKTHIPGQKYYKGISHDIPMGSIRRLPSSCSSIDEILEGGFEYGTITEIYGDGGSGKTNLCLITARSAARRNERVLYMDTEGVSSERISQIFRDDHESLKRIVFTRPKSLSEQYAIISDVANRINEYEFKLIIVDSVTQLYRLERKDSKMSKEILNSIIGLLLSIAREGDACVIVTNQVYGDFSGDVKPVGGSILDHSAKIIIKLRKIGDNEREAILVKHRSIPEHRVARFKIIEDGLL